MSIKKGIVCVGLAVLATACGNQKKVEPTHIGKYDSNVKGYVVEDMPSFTSESIENLIKNEGLEPMLKWQHLDLEQDGFFGVSADSSYEKLKLKQEKEIIVAVIDSGVDYKHEDLKDVMWINKNEIPDNGIDDDNNGYIDDIHGWNFIGGKDGSHLNDETLEDTRLYKKLLTKVQSGHLLSEEEAKLYKTLEKFVNTEKAKYSKQHKAAKLDSLAVKAKKEFLKETIGVQSLDSREKIAAIESEDEKVLEAKKVLLTIWDKYWRGFAGLERAIEMSKYYAHVGYNINFNARAEIVQDDPSDFTDTNYGNNDVKGPDSSHGTHVAGIIAAKRNNGLGIDGIAGNVKIMALRAVPNGDERDKDIALSVRYAVDNGATVINMSFGKKYSPYKAQVDKAFQYAASKGVLLVHAAGNSSKNINGGINNFPNHYVLEGSGVLEANKIGNWLEIGASTKDFGLDLIAEFSNYGSEAVTLFSPGHRIYSTTPENNYAAYSGTSMASPVAAGVATLLLSEFPTMTAEEARTILVHTVSKHDGLEVRKPSEDRRSPDFRLPVQMNTLSAHDGIISAKNALELATRLSN